MLWELTFLAAPDVPVTCVLSKSLICCGFFLTL